MKLIYKIMLSLFLASFLPVIGLGISAYRSMSDIRNTATSASIIPLLKAEKDRLHQLTREKALSINAFISVYQNDVVNLRDAFLSLRGAFPRFDPSGIPDRYPNAGISGLPGYGYLDPSVGAYADFERKGEGCPWLPRWAVERIASDPSFRAETTNLLHQVMALNPFLSKIGEKNKGTQDLAWIVLESGPTNVYPPYDYREVIRRKPDIIDLHESEEEYVRLANPANNPHRRVLWLEPYYDSFKLLWMTSCVAPLYDGDRFLGTVGLDLLLPTITRQILQLNPGGQGYAFLLASSGKLIAVPERGIPDLIGEESHRQALLQTFLPADRQRWSPEEIKTLAGISLKQNGNIRLQEVAAMMTAGEETIVEIPLGGSQKFVSFVPIEKTGWSLGIVMPVEEVTAQAQGVERSITEGTERIMGQFFLFLGILGIIVASVVLFLHIETIRPLNAFAAKVGQLSWDNLTVDPEPHPRADEIGHLHRKFAEMVRMIMTARDEVTAKSTELHRSNLSLEAEVEERKRAEEALSGEKERLAVTLRSIGDGVITTDVEGRVTMLNRVAEDLTAWAQEEAVGRPLEEVFRIIHQSTRKPCENPAEKVIRTGAIIGLANHTVLIARDGRERVIADSGAPIRDSSSRIIGVVLVFRDVTAQERRDHELQRAAKLDSVGILAGGIAHDFNNLLTAILGNIGLARLEAKASGQLETPLEQAETAALRAKDLAGRLLTFAKGSAPVKKLCRLEAIARDAANVALSGSTSTCRFDFPADLPFVEADPSQISQVMYNLLINAVQAMPHGGEILIRGEAVSARLGGSLPLPQGNYVSLTVEDRGVGIPEQILGNIFDPFFTTKPDGSGLGLTVVHSILKSHRGHATLKSEAGKGTAVSFYLPSASGEPEKRESDAPFVGKGIGRILVMDDEEVVRVVLQKILEQAGYEVTATAKGEEAIDTCLQAKDTPFDLIILDLTIRGGMGGAKTLERLRREGISTPAIASSGYSSDSIMANPAEFGFAAALPKPYDISDLYKLVHRLLPPREPVDRT